MKKNILCGMFLIGLLSLSVAWAEFPAQDDASVVSKCSNYVDVKSKSKERFDGTGLMTVAAELERQGEDSFQLNYDNPKSICEVESFEGSGMQIRVLVSPWEKGDQTLLFKVMATSPTEQREILVLYNGLASLVTDKPMFHVSEKRNGIVSWYAMYKEQPTYAALKPLFLDILADNAKPLLAVKWPLHAKEGVMVDFDSKRVK